MRNERFIELVWICVDRNFLFFFFFVQAEEAD